MSTTGDLPYNFDENTSIKNIFPIGSIIFQSEPLGSKYVWENVQSVNELTVEWGGCTWLLITESEPRWAGATHGVTSTHSVRNCRIDCIRVSNDYPFTAILRSDSQGFNSDTSIPPTLNTFTGENTHKLIPEEMPVHNHNVTWRGYWSLNNGEGVEKNCRSDTWYDTDPSRTLSCDNAGGLNGETQPHNNKELALGLFMYRRIA